jgi:hypothetical protein
MNKSYWLGKMLMPQHDNAASHTSAANSVVIALLLKLFHTLPTTQIWHCWILVFWGAFKKHLKAIHVVHDEVVPDDMQKWFWEQSECSTETGGTVLNKSENAWKNGIEIWSTHSGLYCVFCLILVYCLVVKTPTLRHYFPNKHHILGDGYLHFYRFTLTYKDLMLLHINCLESWI